MARDELQLSRAVGPQFNCVVLRRGMGYTTLMLQKKLGQRIAELRRTRELTQLGLAKRIGCSVEFISLVERGVNAPSVAGLEKFARVLKVGVVDLFTFTARKTQPKQRRAG
jgi:ribosome-binding protein aMBF1 (putative translation factor)